MSNQPQLESKKDEDFDFFKKPKISHEQIVETEISSQISNNKQSTHKNEKNFIYGFGVFIMALVIGSVMLSEKNNDKPVYVTPNGGWVVSQPPAPNPVLIQEESNFTTPKDTINNIDYSNLTKEDAERVKQALEQVKDLQKTLIETNKPVTKPQQ